MRLALRVNILFNSLCTGASFFAPGRGPGRCLIRAQRSSPNSFFEHIWSVVCLFPGKPIVGKFDVRRRFVFLTGIALHRVGTNAGPISSK